MSSVGRLVAILALGVRLLDTLCHGLRLPQIRFNADEEHDDGADGAVGDNFDADLDTLSAMLSEMLPFAEDSDANDDDDDDDDEGRSTSEGAAPQVPIALSRDTFPRRTNPFRSSLYHAPQSSHAHPSGAIGEPPRSQEGGNDIFGLQSNQDLTLWEEWGTPDPVHFVGLGIGGGLVQGMADQTSIYSALFDGPRSPLSKALKEALEHSKRARQAPPTSPGDLAPPLESEGTAARTSIWSALSSQERSAAKRPAPGRQSERQDLNTTDDADPAEPEGLQNWRDDGAGELPRGSRRWKALPMSWKFEDNPAPYPPLRLSLRPGDLSYPKKSGDRRTSKRRTRLAKPRLSSSLDASTVLPKRPVVPSQAVKELLPEKGRVSFMQGTKTGPTAWVAGYASRSLKLSPEESAERRNAHRARKTNVSHICDAADELYDAMVDIDAASPRKRPEDSPGFGFVLSVWSRMCTDQVANELASEVCSRAEYWHGRGGADRLRAAMLRSDVSRQCTPELAEAEEASSSDEDDDVDNFEDLSKGGGSSISSVPDKAHIDGTHYIRPKRMCRCARKLINLVTFYAKQPWAANPKECEARLQHSRDDMARRAELTAMTE